MIRAASQVIVLLDSSKFGIKSMTPVLALRDIRHLVTDADAPPEIIAELRQAGIDVHLVE
jgi:DeoR/GlpR family transcriptional regulator of sugar metabolism